MSSVSVTCLGWKGNRRTKGRSFYFFQFKAESSLRICGLCICEFKQFTDGKHSEKTWDHLDVQIFFLSFHSQNSCNNNRHRICIILGITSNLEMVKIYRGSVHMIHKKYTISVKELEYLWILESTLRRYWGTTRSHMPSYWTLNYCGLDLNSPKAQCLSSWNQQELTPFK